VDVYRNNACMGGEYNYSPLLLRVLAWLPGTSLTVPGGLGLDLLFIAATLLLPAARGPAETWFRIICFCAAITLHLLEPANLDTLNFAAVMAGVWLLARPGLARVAGYALFLLIAALKYYPAVLLGLALRERLARLALLGALLLLAVLLFLLRYGHGTAVSLRILPAGLPFYNLFGAINVPFGLALLRFLPVRTMTPSSAQFLAAVSQPYVGAYVALASWGLIGAGLFTGVRLAGRYRAKLAALSELERLCLVAGGLVICFCFYATQNLDYRACFLLLTLPGLWRIGDRVLLGGVLFLLWEAVGRHLAQQTGYYAEALFWALREYVWWFVVVRLTAVVAGWMGETLRLRLGELRGFARVVAVRR
jgi:hypothetical protein